MRWHKPNQPAVQEIRFGWRLEAYGTRLWLGSAADLRSLTRPGSNRACWKQGTHSHCTGMVGTKR